MMEYRRCAIPTGTKGLIEKGTTDAQRIIFGASSGDEVAIVR